MPEWGGSEPMHARMGGGLLQDTVSPLGDMVHFNFVNKLLVRKTEVCL
jgi:hypothetical protein